MKSVSFIIVSMVFIAGFHVCYGDNQVKSTMPFQQERGRFYRGPGIWKVFLRLTPEEKKALLELQRNDPEKFRVAIKQRADEILKKEQVVKTAMNNLAKKYLECKNEIQKKQLKQELYQIVRNDFNQKLEDHRRNLEINRQRIVRMEQELKKRSANIEKIIETKVDALLENKSVSNQHQ